MCGPWAPLLQHRLFPACSSGFHGSNGGSAGGSGVWWAGEVSAASGSMKGAASTLCLRFFPHSKGSGTSLWVFYICYQLAKASKNLKSINLQVKMKRIVYSKRRLSQLLLLSISHSQNKPDIYLCPHRKLRAKKCLIILELVSSELWVLSWEKRIDPRKKIIPDSRLVLYCNTNGSGGICRHSNLCVTEQL